MIRVVKKKEKAAWHKSDRLQACLSGPGYHARKLLQESTIPGRNLGGRLQFLRSVTICGWEGRNREPTLKQSAVDPWLEGRPGTVWKPSRRAILEWYGILLWARLFPKKPPILSIPGSIRKQWVSQLVSWIRMRARTATPSFYCTWLWRDNCRSK